MIDYALKVDPEQLDNSTAFYNVHLLRGGTFTTIHYITDTKNDTTISFNDEFSDRCDCEGTPHIKVLPLIFSNN